MRFYLSYDTKLILQFCVKTSRICHICGIVLGVISKHYKNIYFTNGLSILIYRGSDMSAHVLLDLLNKVRKRDKM